MKNLKLITYKNVIGLVSMCEMHNNLIEHKHPHIANKRQGILYAKEFECAWFVGKACLAMPTCYLANGILLNSLFSANRAMELH